MAEMDPINERGIPIKRRGLFLKDNAEFEGFNDIFMNQRVLGLLMAIENVGGKEKKGEAPPIEI